MPFSPEEIRYNPKAGRYVRADGKFVGREVIRNLVDQEQQQLAVRLKAHTRLMAQGQIPLAEWQLRMAGSLKDAHLRSMTLGSGGKDSLTNRHYGATGYQLRQQFAYLDGFAKALADGKLTAKQAIARAALYADSITVTFGRAEQISREESGFDEALRSLDSQAQHCGSCVGHSTNGQWKPIEEVITPGVNCECGGHCRCSVIYRRRPSSSALNREGILAA